MLPNPTDSASTSRQDVTDEYFTEYSDWTVHELMLRDKVRTETFRDAVEANAHLFKGKVVMDVGAGTGILSLFCARSGAGKVYAVEASDIAGLSKQILQKNGYEHVIEVINKKVEEIDDMDELEVDIIISEWMGFYLLHESMLDSVIYARDKWLKEDGCLFPSLSYLYLSPVNMDTHIKDSVDSWTDFYGFDFSPVVTSVKLNSLSKPSIMEIEESQLLSEPKIIASFDLKTVTQEDITSVFQSLNFDIELTDTTATRSFHGFACWFDCVFAGHASAKPVTLSTRPGVPPTHWKQTVFLLPQSADVKHDDVVSCYVTLTQSIENKRHYDICIDLQEEDEDGEIDFEGKDHPVPCECGATRCVLVKTLLEKYAQEENQRQKEEENNLQE